MPIRPSKGKVRPRYIEFPSDLDRELQSFADGRGESVKKVILDALRRHMDNPPPLPELPPLPPVVVGKPEEKKPRKRK